MWKISSTRRDTRPLPWSSLTAYLHTTQFEGGLPMTRETTVILVWDEESEHYGAWVQYPVDLEELRLQYCHFSLPPTTTKTQRFMGLTINPASESLWARLLLMALLERAEIWKRTYP